MSAIQYDSGQRRASVRQRLLNCAAWNIEHAKRAESQGDKARADRLWENGRRLHEQVEGMEIGGN